MVIGAGKGKSGKVYHVGEFGGEERVTLTKEELPEHFHVIPHMGSDYAITGPKEGPSYGVTRTIQPENTEPSGMGGSHENMPPWLALVYCKKE